MLIPLGIIASSGARAGGSYELIETITVGSGGAASVTFSNLNTYSSTYQHLQVRAVVRSNQSGGLAQTFAMRMNGDTGSNYRTHVLRGTGSSVVSGTGSGSEVEIGTIAGAAMASGNFAANIIDILDPYEAKNKTARVLNGSTGGNQVELRSWLWMNTDSLTSITFTSYGNSFVENTRFSIYGLKAS